MTKKIYYKRKTINENIKLLKKNSLLVYQSLIFHLYEYLKTYLRLIFIKYIFTFALEPMVSGSGGPLCGEENHRKRREICLTGRNHLPPPPTLPPNHNQ
jgi:hypothetical protein